MKQGLPKAILFMAISLFSALSLTAQSKLSIALNYVKSHSEQYGLKSPDVMDVREIDENTDNATGVTHIYLSQYYKGVEVYNAVMGVHMMKNKVVDVTSAFQSNLAAKVQSTIPAIQPSVSVANALNNVNIPFTGTPAQITNIPDHVIKPNEYRFDKDHVALNDIFSELMLYPNTDGTISLVWAVNIYKLDALAWWNIFVDAKTGAVIYKYNNVVSCNFSPRGVTDEPGEVAVPNQTPLSPTVIYDFNVLPLYSEAVSFYPRAIFNSPWLASPVAARPFNWLNDGTNTYTYSRGNNVWAYVDTLNTNTATVLGSATTAGTSDFNFPINFAQSPATYMPAATTNLFVANNHMHDVWYSYGFNEAGRNFQNNNNGLGGAALDAVQAEAQDSRAVNPPALNNANFATPADGAKPRMQMYLWSGGVGLTINSPASIAGNYVASSAAFGSTANGQTANIVYALTGHDGCAAFTNAAAMNGKLALIDRGNCTFIIKTKNAQNAGAIGVIIVDSVAGEAPVLMGGTDATITIPTVMISKSDGAIIKPLLPSGVNGTLNGTPFLDGDLDNGVIYHEYGHGITHRSTGNGSSCVSNAETGDEGWSDWYALVMTHKSGDAAGTPRPIGTYVINQAPTGAGIRSHPYSYNMTVNPLTYSYVATSGGEVHSIGEVWCSALWDMYWLLVNKYGFDPNIYNGTGGNNRAMKLVIDGLKLQICNPGFLDSRNAILKADTLDYAAADACEIWNAFARRGMGVNAVQGSANSTADQTEGFTLPTGCNAIVLPVTLVSFNATAVNDQINLAWKTSGEYNNAGFELQRKSNVNEPFVTIAHIAPKGVGGNGADYTYEDHNVSPNIVYYYQLIQRDNDGRVNYSSVAAAIIHKLQPLNVIVYPNPVDKNVSVQFGTGFDNNVVVKIIDITGRTMYNKTLSNLSNTKLSIDMSAYSAGVYELSVGNVNNKQVMKIIKK